MITKTELEDYAKITGLPLGHAEKDYFLNLLLFIIYREYGNELVFKGGTALKKCYGLDRFSEDLDFNSEKKIDIKKIESILKRFRIEHETKTTEYKDEQKFTLLIKGPLHIGIRQSLCQLVIDISIREPTTLPPKTKTIGRFMEEIPSFDVCVMDEKEILSEKIRAVMSRSKARDIYDIWFLVNKGTEFDKNLTDQKLSFYKIKWDRQEFKKKLKEKEPIWTAELRQLIRTVPHFNEVENTIIKTIK